MSVSVRSARLWSRAVVLATLLTTGGYLPRAEHPRAALAHSTGTEAAIATLKQQGTYASLQAAVEHARYGVRPASNVPDASSIHVANNPAHRYQATFTPAGLTLASSDNARPWRVGITLATIGRSGAAVPVSPGAVTAGGTRVALAQRAGDVALTEWFDNAAIGLEQGVTINERPAISGAGPLTLTWQVRGDLRPMAGASDQAMTWVGADNEAVLKYDHLLVQDRNGLTVPAHFDLTDASVAIVVDDAAAAYPLTIDPTWTQQAYLKASNTEAVDQFGTAIAISGDTVVVTAPTEDSNATGVNGNQTDNSALSSGAAYVFTRSGTTWSQQAYLKASNTDANDLFGFSVAISGDTIVVGAIGESSNAVGVNGAQGNNLASNSGAAYVFTRSGSTWSQQAYLKASNTGTGDGFGFSVGVSGDTAVVGARFEDSNGTGVDSATQADNSVINSGAAYVFTRSGSTWSQQAYLKASNTGSPNDEFGYAVTVSGDTAVVGAYREDSNSAGVNGNQADNSTSDSGAAYVFTRSGSTWSQQAYLKASNPGDVHRFGFALAVSGDTVLVGAQGETSNATGINGNQSDTSAAFAGAAYVFTRSGSTWSQQAYLKASNTDATDFFGYHVALSGDLAVIGAIGEDSNATGVDGSQGNGTGTTDDSGAAYVFKRSGTTWSQQAYLKASNTGAGDQFGIAVAVSGTTVVAGATAEASNATGVNGTQSDNSANLAGAAYVFLGSFDQTITFGALTDMTFGAAAFDVSATATSNLTVTFSAPVTTPANACSVSGPSGATVTINAAGTCTIAADQAGDTTYNAAPQVTRTFTVSKASQTITFATLASKTFGDAAFGVSATATSNLTVTFSAPVTTPANACSASGTSGATITINATGTCTIAADQVGNTNYNAAPQVARTFTVAKANQTITFATLANKTFGDAQFNVNATTTSNLTVTFSAPVTTPANACSISSATVTINTTGTCTIAADQAGNTNFNAAPQVTRNFTVAKADQTITFNALAAKTFGDAPFGVSATATSGLTVALSSTADVCTVSTTTVTIVAAGTCTITAVQAGNTNYNAATPATQTFTVTKVIPLITLQLSAERLLSAGPFDVTVSTTPAGLSVTFSSTSNCTVSGATVTPVAVGTCTITASHSADANTEAATGSATISIIRGSETRMAIDTPGLTVPASTAFTVSGWAIDTGMPSGRGAGVDAVDISVYPVTNGVAGTGTFVGRMAPSIQRDDIAAVFGAQFGPSGWSVSATGLPVGQYRLVAQAHSLLADKFNGSQVRDFTVVAPVSEPRLAVDTPTENLVIRTATPFTVAGWAIDKGASSGVGVDRVDVWRYPVTNGVVGQQGTFVGSVAAAQFTPRPDVAAIFGSQFGTSGWSYSVAGGLPIGNYQLVAYAHSLIANDFNASQATRLTVIEPVGTPAIHMSLDTPNGTPTYTAAAALRVVGWAVDTGALTGIGVDRVDVWLFTKDANGVAGGGQFIGSTTPNLVRQDVGAALGAQFTNSGFYLNIPSGLGAGKYTLTVFPHSTVSNAFGSAAQADIVVDSVVSTPLVRIDAPLDGSTLPPSFLLMGSAIDRGATTTTGIDQVVIYGTHLGVQQPIGVATIGEPRSDIGDRFGPNFDSAGFSFNVTGLEAGAWTLIVFAHSTLSGNFSAASINITVASGASNELMALDAPGDGATFAAGAPIAFRGWALDLGASTGVGVDEVVVYSGQTRLGVATLGGSRPDVGAAFGARFTNSGFTFTYTPGLPAGSYRLLIYAHSTVSGVHGAVKAVSVRVAGP